MTKCHEERLDGNIRDSALPFLAALDTARALTVTILLRHHEYRQLAELKADPNQYECAVKYAKDSAATDLLRKYAGLPVGVDTRSAAVEAFWKAERACGKTNKRLKDFTEGCVVNHDPLPTEIYQSVGFMRDFTREVLGSLPLNLEFRFGPGATVSDGAKLATVPDKCSSTPSVTSGAGCIIPLWDATAWARAHYRRQHARISKPIQQVRGNIFFTVRKTSLTDRGAAKGPSVNVSAQLGVGREVRKKLKYIGIDLQDGQELHQTLARESSLNDDLVTIDLKQASDTVAYQFVKLILPSLWFDLLDTLREPFTKVDGRWCFLEKFSAMGNGFTFELETLGFLAIIASAVRLHGDDIYRLIANHEVSVYGDDIIVPKRYSATVVSLLRFYGFQMNEQKTFLSGSFRESCGGDFYDGHRVTPFRLTDEVVEPHQWISFHNGLLSWLNRFRSEFGVILSADGSLRRILGNLPAVVRRLTGPSWLGDVVIHGSETWRANLKYRANRWWLPTWQPFSTLLGWEHWYGDVVLASALYDSRDKTRGISPRGVTGYRVKRVGRPMFAWDDSHAEGPLVKRIEAVTGGPGVKTLKPLRISI